MIPVVKVMADGAGPNNHYNKKSDQLQRQDSGFISGSPTPVTPSHYDIHQGPAPVASYLPTIPETTSPVMNQVNTTLVENVCSQEISGIRPSRPTTLSPHAPPPLLQNNKEDMTPLTPGKVVRLYHETGGQLPDHYEQYIQKKASEIVQREVPDTPLIEDRLPIEKPSEEELSQYYPLQKTVHPVNTTHLRPGHDGCYYEYRDYYRVEEDLLGEGSFGTVYACHDRVLPTMFAIKCNKQDNSMVEECNMLHEIGDHVNITQFWGALEENCHTDGTRFKMMMECAINGNLRELLYDYEAKEPCGLPVDQSLYYLQQILFAVDYLHQRSILHLDLKCANILVFNEGRTVKLTDFGSSVKLNDLSGQSIKVGFTVHFSAPEVILARSVSFSADVWSVMCCFVEMLTGSLPWCYQNSREQHHIILLIGHYKESTDFNMLVPYKDLQLDEEVTMLFRRVFKADPEFRPSALELLKDPLICEAHQYEKLFDGFECDDVATPPPPPLEEIPIDKMSIGETQAKLVQVQQSVDSGTCSDKDSSNEASPYSANIEETNFPNGSGRHRDSGISIERTLKDIKSLVNFSCSSSSFASSKIITQSCSAPSDSRGGHWEESERDDCKFHGDDDVEKDGKRLRNGKILKRTTSANYVSNGPEADSPDGRRNKCSLPFVTSSGTAKVSVGTQTNLSPTVESRAQLGTEMVLSYSQYYRSSR